MTQTIENLPSNLVDALRHFSDPMVRLETVASVRWPNGPRCPKCASKRLSFLKTRLMWKCLDCRKQFSVKVGTIFQDSPIGLDKWLCAMWMIANCRNGVSSYEIARAIHVTQKTAWFMLQRLRHAMHTGSIDKLTGEIEADETYIGAKARNMHIGKRREKITGSGMTGKVAVMSLLERHGKVRTLVIPDRTQPTLRAVIRENVKIGSQLHTDGVGGYRGIDAEAEYIYNVIGHAEAYVKGNVHTNGLENF